MSNPPHSRRALRFGLAAFILTFVAVPVAGAQAAPVNLATTAPFAVLGGSTVTNTGPSVLNGDLGLSPGPSISGFPPGIVNGVTHVNDAVAQQAQSDLTTAYDVAAAQPISADLSNTDLGNRTLQAGAYGFSSDAQLTGPLTLDAAGDPNAQFVFVIGSALTTASASSVNLINGASPCNVFWKVGSSATLGSATAFEGNLLALTSITANTSATVRGRLLARNGAVTLDTNTITTSTCAPPATTPPGSPPTGSPPTGSPPTDSTPTGSLPTDSTPTDSTPTAGRGDAGAAGTPAGGASGGSASPTGSGTAQVPPASRSTLTTRRGTAKLRRVPRTSSTKTPTSCREGFTATVRGSLIRQVVFTLDGRRVATRKGSPFTVTVKANSGAHTLKARVTFKDATRAKTLKLGYRVCSTIALRPKRGPSQFTG